MSQIFKSAINYSIGNYSSKLIAILIFPIVVTYLGLENTGKFDLVISTVGILRTLFSLHIGDAMYRWFQCKNIQDQQISFSNGLVITLIMLFTVNIIYVCLYVFFPYPIELLTISFFILISQIILSVLLQLIRGEGRVTRYTLIGIIKSIVFTLFSLLVVIYTENKLHNIFLVLIGTNVVCIIVAVCGFNFQYYFKKSYISFSNTKKLIKYSIPLILNAFSWIGFFTANKYILFTNFGLNNNGVFAVAEKLSTGVFFKGMFYYYSLQDYSLSSSNFQKEKSFFIKIIKRTLFILLMVTIIIILGSWFFIPMFFPDLILSLKFLPWLAFANLFIALAGYMGIPYNYKKETISMSLTSFFGLIISLLLSLLLISHIGIYGICISILVGSIFVFIARLKYTLTFFNKNEI